MCDDNRIVVLFNIVLYLALHVFFNVSVRRVSSSLDVCHSTCSKVHLHLFQQSTKKYYLISIQNYIIDQYLER